MRAAGLHVGHIGVHLGQLLGERGLHGREAKAGLGVEIEGRHAEADGEPLALPLGEAEEPDELADGLGQRRPGSSS